MIFKKVRKIIVSKRIKRIAEDAFIKRVKSLVIGEGMLQDGNIYSFDYAIKNMPKNGCVLEIGSYGGLSLNVIIHLMKKNNRTETVINCDPWVYEGFNDQNGEHHKMIDGKTNVLRTQYSVYMKEAFKSGILFLHKNDVPFSFDYTSNDFFEDYKNKKNVEDIFGKSLTLGGAISFAYIDGNHSYNQTKLDFENVDRYLLKGGFVLFDDSFDSAPFGSAVFMNEVKRNPNYELVHKNPNYLFRKRV